jgi:hypothetical protein
MEEDKTIKIVKVRGVLEFHNFGNSTLATYDYKDESMTLDGKPVRDLAKIFKRKKRISDDYYNSGYISNLKQYINSIEDEKLKEFFLYVKKENKLIKNFDTLISVSQNYTNQLAWFNFGITHISSKYHSANISPSHIDKRCRTIMTKLKVTRFDITFSHLANKCPEETYNKCSSCKSGMGSCDLNKEHAIFINGVVYAYEKGIITTPTEFIDFLDMYSHDKYKELVDTYNYEYKSLLNYTYNYLCKYESMNERESFSWLRDYYRIAKDISVMNNVKPEKYPKMLKSKHDILMNLRNSMKREIDEKKFALALYPELSFESKKKSVKYVITTPTTGKDLVLEGSKLGHCVGDYIADIADKKTKIVFMRLKESPEVPLVTVEVKSIIGENGIVGNITQALGTGNRYTTPEEKTFLQLYAKEMKLGFRVEN